MLHDELAEIIQHCTRELFSTMLGTEIVIGKTYFGEEPATPSEGVLALVGLAGAWAGTGMVCSRAETARAMSGLMLMQEFAVVDDEVLDAVGEVTNMIFGNVKTALEEKLGPMGLSIPTVIYGRNFNARTLGKKEWTVVTFSWPGQEFEVHLCLTMAPKEAVHLRPVAGVALI
jgi:chemotaxis protein CheX